MDYTYQIIILGFPDLLWPDIKELLYKRIGDLGLQKDFYQVIMAADFAAEYKTNQPTYALYFGDPAGDFADEQQAIRLLDDGKMVLPIFHNSFSTEIPPILKNQNGLEYDNTQDERIVNLILESFGKLRDTRKVFVSYKRSESTSVAIQLYEALERNNFDVFLDTHSIIQGEAFQEELWHRMTDCDVIVLLNTPKFLESYWCKEELAEASAKQIGIIPLVWPGHALENTAAISYPMVLKAADFVDDNHANFETDKLIAAKVQQIVEKVESVRARNLAARQDDLIKGFLQAARRQSKNIYLQPERYLTQVINEYEKRVFIPAVGIPKSTDYNESSLRKDDIEDFENAIVYLIYDHVRIRDKWLRHLDYLDLHLDVQTIKKTDFDIWMEHN